MRLTFSDRQLEMSLNQRCAGALEEIRKRTPLCHCITNYVSMDIMANTLLAIGASPIMVVLLLSYEA